MKKSFLPMLSFSLAVAGLAFAPAAFGHDDEKGHDISSHEVHGNSGVTTLRDDVHHVRKLYNHVQEELASYGSNKHIRSEMGHINAELDHVDEELTYRNVDNGHIREELAHIHDELHHVEEELHDLGARQSDPRGGGFRIEVR